jgi:copper chaperone NosL
MRAFPPALFLLALFAMSACEKKPAPPPPPSILTDAATDHYSEMIIVAHFGPKGQIHLLGQKAPLWFSSVRKTIAYTLSPEKNQKISAIYVTDMAKTSNWKNPDPSAWVDARKAWYVINGKIAGRAIVGGMGMPEAVPFSDKTAAQAYARKHDGKVVRMNEIPHAFFSLPTLPDDKSTTYGVSKP